MFRIDLEFGSHYTWSLSWTFQLNLSWTFQLELILNKADGGDISTYVPNGEWDLIGKKKDMVQEKDTDKDTKKIKKCAKQRVRLDRWEKRKKEE